MCYPGENDLSEVWLMIFGICVSDEDDQRWEESGAAPSGPIRDERNGPDVRDREDDRPVVPRGPPPLGLHRRPPRGRHHAPGQTS